MRPGPGPGWSKTSRFQSTHSLRSATQLDENPGDKALVSIHALLAECDGADSFRLGITPGFNPRTPCGVRQDTVIFASENVLFQSTHSLRSATEEACLVELGLKVSIHALLAECDSVRRKPAPGPCCFNPRTPCGVRPMDNGDIKDTDQFQSTHSLRSATDAAVGPSLDKTVSIHALLAECDKILFSLAIQQKVSIHALLAECDRPLPGVRPVKIRFNPRTPCGVRLIFP